MPKLHHRNESGRPAAAPVEQRHELRHLGHFDSPCRNQADGRTDHDHHHDDDEVVQFDPGEEQQNGGDECAHGTDEGAKSGRFR